MKYLPPNVSDVNEDPKRLGQSTALSAWLTSAEDDKVFEAGEYAWFLKKCYSPFSTDRRIFIFGIGGYIGNTVKYVLSQVGINVIDAENTDKMPNKDDVLVHLACPRKSSMSSSTEVVNNIITWLNRASNAIKSTFRIDPKNILYFASQCVYNEPANDPYSLMKRVGAEQYIDLGATVLYPGTVFGHFRFLGIRQDTVLNKLALREAEGKEIFTSAAVRSFITIHEIVEAVLCFCLGLSVEPFQCYNIGRCGIVELVDPEYKHKHLVHDTGTSLANFFPYMLPCTMDMYRSYYGKLVRSLKGAK